MKIELYSTDYCPFCVRAKQLLVRSGLGDFEEIKVDRDPIQRLKMIERSGRRSVPQIFIDGRHVGGFDDLAALHRAGGLVAAVPAQD
jgi:glutaredoxin 3